MIISHGKLSSFPVKFSGTPTFFEASDAGGNVSTSLGSFAVDFSRASGADALLVLAGPIKGTPEGAQVVQAGKNTFTVMTIQQGKPPEPC